MRAKPYLFWGSLLALLSGAIALARPARLLAARVTAVTPGDPPTASVGLTYGRGVPPATLIVDVYGSDGSGGSATIDGRQLFAEVPIAGTLSGEYHVTTTAAYRVLGVLRTSVREFVGQLAPTTRRAS